MRGGGQRGTLRQFYNFYHFLTFQKPDICDFLLIWRLYILKLYFCLFSVTKSQILCNKYSVILRGL